MKNLCIVLFAFCSLMVWGQDGSPDISFGDNGVVLTSFGESTIEISAVHQGVSGRIAVLGTEYPVLVDTVTFIQVYHGDGTVDTSFGDNGIVSFVDNIGAPVNRIKVLNDNSIIYGYGGSTIKLLPNGTVDISFGNNGSIDLDLSATDTLGHVLHPDGSIYVYGKQLTGDEQFIIKKFDSNGVVDASFGNQGLLFLLLDVYGVFSENNIQFLVDDALLLNYSSRETGNYSVNHVVKIDGSGEIDTSFGVNGYVESVFFGLENSHFHRLYSGGFFISYAANDSGDFVRRIEAYTPNGNLNTSFAANGVLADQSVSFIQQNQRLVTRQDIPDMNNAFIPELNRIFVTGISDPSFDFQFNYAALSSPVVSQTADGKIIIAGAMNEFPDSNLVLLRHNNTPLSITENHYTTLKIVPNPTSDFITISCATCTLINQPYQITDAAGKIIREAYFDLANPTLSFENFSAGLYFLNVSNATVKIIKE